MDEATIRREQAKFRAAHQKKARERPAFLESNKEKRLVAVATLDEQGNAISHGFMPLDAVRKMADLGHNIHEISGTGADTVRLGKRFNKRHIRQHPHELAPDRKRTAPPPLPKAPKLAKPLEHRFDLPAPSEGKRSR